MREAQGLVDRLGFDGAGIVVILGLGLGYHIAPLLSRFPDTRLIIVEALASCEELTREQGIVTLDAERITCISGQSSTVALQRISELQIAAGMPKLTLFALPAAVAALPDYYLPVQEKLETGIRLDLPGRLRHQRFTGAERRVLLFDCGYLLTREVAAALEGLGHAVHRLHFTSLTPVGQLMADLVGAIASFRPDFCLTINHLGFDEGGEIARFLDAIRLPAASWFVDSPDLIVKGFDRNVTPHTSLFIWDQSYFDSMLQSGFESVTYLPLGTDPDLFRLIPRTAPELAGFSARVGFVGNSMTVPLQDSLDKIDPALHPLAEILGRRMSTMRGRFGQVMAELEPGERQLVSRLNTREQLDFEKAVTWQATLLYRLGCIDRLRDFRPVIHGDKGWRSLLSGEFTLRPPLTYYHDLPFFYNACTVNFNATSLQMGTAVNQRLFDCPLCGGFLLTDHQEAIEGLFEVGTEVITYREEEEITDLVRFYLENNTARERIAAKGRERVLAQHTYHHRLRTLIETMEQRYR